MASIRKTRTEKWELDFYSSGVRQRITFDSRREAEEAKRQVMLGLPADHEESLKPMALKEGLRFYGDNVSKKKASHQNEKDYLTRLYKSLRAQGCTLFSDVSPDHLEVFKTERSQKCKASTINREFNTIRHVFSKAVDWKWILKNPCEAVSTLPEAKNPRRVWTQEEFSQVVAKVPPWARVVLQVMYWTGAGPMELSRVTWMDVDFGKRTILLKRIKGSGKEFRRFIHMPDGLLEFMRSLLYVAKAERRAKAKDLVFVNSKGNPIDARPLATTVRRAVRFHGLPEGTVPYGIRHTVATEQLEAGVPEDVVRRQLGHQSVRTLIENYSHVRDAAMKSAMNVREKQLEKHEEERDS
jgi:site-specific recombinase XerD